MRCRREGRLILNAYLKRISHTRLLQANQEATKLLLKGTEVKGGESGEDDVDGPAGQHATRGETVHFIDWDRPENNSFRAINQFKLDCPAGSANKDITPDVVLFVNGIPVVVIEAKRTRADARTQLQQAVDQLQRYANARRGAGVVNANEGNPALFRYVQFMIATCGDEARAGTITSQAVHYAAWKDTCPVEPAEVAAELGRTDGRLTAQEVLVAGMLRPANLLDIIRHFTLFMESGGRTVKVVCRYQQFRAVRRAMDRLLTRKTREQDGEHDRRGGIIWHTQGSGKSLTMVFLIRSMRSHPRLRGFKVIVVTDRRDLERQLVATAELTDEPLTRVRPVTRGSRTVSSQERLQEVLQQPGKDLVFAMIQKYRGTLVESEDPEEENDGTSGPLPEPARLEPLPELNPSSEILVLVDEAHRSHTSVSHANLMNALPNCARIGFTGTPIIMRDKGRTAEIFGEEIDRYTIVQAQQDGATVPILYEGRTTNASVDSGGELDAVFDDLAAEYSDEQMEAIKQKYATKNHVAEARELIGQKARNMLRHWVANILPNGFKAQVVAVTRRATIRYYEAFMEARDELVTELESLSPALTALDEPAVSRLDDDLAYLVRAHRYLPTIRILDFAPVISGGHNDPVDPTGMWTTSSAVEARIARFKKPLLAEPGAAEGASKTDPLAFLIVKSMLLTGFDAPIAQVMYLDRHIKEAELLQAIARVNRTYARGGVEKEFGFVVDYYGVAAHLQEALKAYASADIDGALQSLADEIPRLREQHLKLLNFFKAGGISDINRVEACVEMLRDERLRAEFQVLLKRFLATLDVVLPRAAALPFTGDAATLALIQASARNRYRTDEALIGEEVGAKVRQLIDDHIRAQGIDPRIAPVEVTAKDFGRHVREHKEPRTQASEMEHALRFHIRKHMDEDPAYYEKLSERLEGILRESKERWQEQLDAFEALAEEVRAGRQIDNQTGLDPRTHAPFYDLLTQGAGADVDSAEQRAPFIALTTELVAAIRSEISILNFWEKATARERLRSIIHTTLDRTDLLPYESLGALTDRLMELAKSNHHRLVE